MKATAEEVMLLKMLTAEPTDPTASAIMFEKFYPIVVDKLTNKHKNVEEDVIRDVVFEVLSNFIGNPSKYDPERATLAAYLIMDANGDLLNKLKKSNNEKKSLKFVEDYELYGNIKEETTTDVEDEQALKLIQEKLQTVFSEPQDVELARMIIRGGTKTIEFVNLLGLNELPANEQQSTVKRHKDRIKNVLKRRGWYTFEEELKQRFL